MVLQQERGFGCLGSFGRNAYGCGSPEFGAETGLTVGLDGLGASTGVWGGWMPFFASIFLDSSDMDRLSG